jgi:hypothetical protein
MSRPPTIWQHILYYGFLTLCTLGFFLTCCGFLFYRLLLKPMVFGLMLLAACPLMLFHHLHALTAKQDEKDDVLVGEA